MRMAHGGGLLEGGEDGLRGVVVQEWANFIITDNIGLTVVLECAVQILGQRLEVAGNLKDSLVALGADGR